MMRMPAQRGRPAPQEGSHRVENERERQADEERRQCAPPSQAGGRTIERSRRARRAPVVTRMQRRQQVGHLPHPTRPLWPPRCSPVPCPDDDPLHRGRAASALAAPLQPQPARASDAPGALVERARARIHGGEPAPLLQRTHQPKAAHQACGELPIGIELRGEVVEAYFDELVPVDRIQPPRNGSPRGSSCAMPRRCGTVPIGRLPAARGRVRGRGRRRRIADDRCAARRRRSPPRGGRAGRHASARRERAPQRCGRSRPATARRGCRDPRRRRGGADGTLRTVLRLDASGAGRPEDVVQALDLPLRRPAVRTRLLFVDTPPIAR